MRDYSFDDVVILHDKERVPLSALARKKRHGVYRYFGAQGIIDYVDNYLFDGDYVLIAEDGENLKSQKQNIANYVSGKFWVNNHAHIVSTTDICRLKYFYYLINNMNISPFITGSAQPKLSQSSMQKMTFKLPDIKTQDQILGILESIDSKIEVNLQINKNLQLQAQAIYTHMIIDEADESWHQGLLSDVATITMGQSPKGDTYNEVGTGSVFFQGRAEFGFRFPTRRLYTIDPKRMAKASDVLMSVRAPVGDLNVAYEDCCIGRGLAAIRSQDNHQSFVLYTMLALRDQLDIFNGEGTVFGSINRESLNNMPIIIPPCKIIDNFESIVSPMDAAIRNNYEESCHLQAIRDRMLPRLMSGKLDASVIDL